MHQLVRNEEGIQEETGNNAIHFIHTLSICNFNQPSTKRKNPKCTSEKNPTVDTDLN